MKSTRATTLRAFGLWLLMSCLACSSLAQRVPASSSDSGRRAVVAIDQNTINNNISNAWNTANNAQNTANWAGAVGSNAQATANWAVDVANAANAAANAGYGKIVGQFNWTNCNGMTSGCQSASGLCITGFPIPSWPNVPPNLCPGGAGYYGGYSVQQADSGGPGGGGAGGGSN